MRRTNAARKLSLGPQLDKGQLALGKRGDLNYCTRQLVYASRVTMILRASEARNDTTQTTNAGLAILPPPHFAARMAAP